MSSVEYTFGAAIAVIIIFFVAIYHVWRFILKKIKQINLSASQLETVVAEIPPIQVEGRKLSSAYIQKLEIFVQYEKNNAGVKISQTKNRAFLRSQSECGTKLERKFSVRRKRNSIAHHKIRQFTDQSNSTKKPSFFAGYSHQYADVL